MPITQATSRLIAIALAAVGALAIVANILPSTQTFAAEEARVIPAPAVTEARPSAESEVAILAGGCFWGVQGVFQHV